MRKIIILVMLLAGCGFDPSLPRTLLTSTKGNVYRVPVIVQYQGRLVLGIERREHVTDKSKTVIELYDVTGEAKLISVIDQEGKTFTNPQLISNGQLLHIVYNRRLAGSGGVEMCAGETEIEILHRVSQDGGKTWSEANIFNFDVEANFINVSPTHGYAREGKLYAAFYALGHETDCHERRHEKDHSFVAVSADDGLTWEIETMGPSGSNEVAFTLSPRLLSSRTYDGTMRSVNGRSLAIATTPVHCGLTGEFVSCPQDAVERKNLTVFDLNGDVQFTAWEGPSAYSNMITVGFTRYLVFEFGDKGAYERVGLITF